MTKIPKLNPDDILKAEYDYIANTAFQANEDRARVSSFYFISVGSIVAAILGTQFAKDSLQSVALAFFFLFAVMTGLGALTIAQLARLRAAWHESAQAMSQLKKFYLEQHPGIKPAFKWGDDTIPKTNKPYSIANLIAVEVAILGALTAGAAIYFLFLWLRGDSWLSWSFIGASALVSFIALWSWYRHLLVDD